MSLRHLIGSLRRAIFNLLTRVVSAFGLQKVKIDGFGIKYLTSPKDALDELTQSHAGFDNGLPYFLNSISPRNGVAVDIGANAGYYTIPLSINFEKVYSFEPVPSIYKKLVKNIKLNEIKNIKPFLSAIGASDEILPFYIQSVVDGDKNLNTGLSSFTRRDSFATKEISIKVNKLDSLLSQENVDLIKVDVEGHEYKVFQGAKEIIGRNKPFIVWEASLNISVINTLQSYDFLTELNYVHYLITNQNELIKLDRKDIKSFDFDFNILSCSNSEVAFLENLCS
jgi:FkbM family methyltransferase